MSVVIDQVVGRVEPEPGPAAGGQGGASAPAPPEPQGALENRLRRLARRRLRLEAD